MRDKLIELIEEASQMWDESPLSSFNEVCADHLLADGWIRPPVRVGHTVWFVSDNLNRREVLEVIVEKEVGKTGGVYMKLSCNAMKQVAAASAKQFSSPGMRRNRR